MSLGMTSVDFLFSRCYETAYKNRHFIEKTKSGRESCRATFWVEFRSTFGRICTSSVSRGSLQTNIDAAVAVVLSFWVDVH